MISPVAYVLKLFVKGYRRFISPLFPPQCKYYPSCSTYALEALERHGAFKGTLLSIWRICRCNPWSKGGVDYIPLKGQWRSGPMHSMSDDELQQYWDKLDSSGINDANGSQDHRREHNTKHAAGDATTVLCQQGDTQ